MPIPELMIIGESINDSVPSTAKLYNESNIDGILELAKTQDQKGAAYLDVNVGRRSPEFMAEIVRKIQNVTAKPLSIDSPDVEIAKAGLLAYEPARALGKAPILNSISPLRLAMFDLLKLRRFMPLLMVSERMQNNESTPNRTSEETCETARTMLALAHEHGLRNDECIIDPGIAPIGSDSEGQLKRVLESVRLIGQDPFFKGVHMSVGLSNFTVMLPPKRADGSPVKGALESAFLTMSMPLGLDMVIGSMVRNYNKLPADHPAMLCLKNCLASEGFDSLVHVQEFYS